MSYYVITIVQWIGLRENHGTPPRPGTGSPPRRRGSARRPHTLW